MEFGNLVSHSCNNLDSSPPKAIKSQDEGFTGWSEWPLRSFLTSIYDEQMSFKKSAKKYADRVGQLSVPKVVREGGCGVLKPVCFLEMLSSKQPRVDNRRFILISRLSP